MSKVKTISLIGLAITLVAVMVILPACKDGSPETVTETVTETVIETVIETVTETVEVESESPFTYENLREYAIKGEAYPGAPAEGFSLGYGDIIGGAPAAVLVWESVKANWELAGGDLDNLYYVDNQYNAQIGLQNADIMLANNPDILIWFQVDANVNSIVAKKFGDAGIPIIAPDVPVPGAPFMGVNNFNVAYMAGEHAIGLVEEQGGIDTVDNIVLLQLPAGGEVTMLRSEGFAQAFVDKYGADVVDPKIIKADGGTGEAEQANTAMVDILASIPNAENIVLTTINEYTMDGAIAAGETLGRYDSEKWICVGQGGDPVGRAQLRDGKVDAYIEYFFEKYGEYLVPAASAILHGNPVPSHMYVDNVVITADNVDEYYPND